MAISYLDSTESVRIAGWNMQVFGENKASDNILLEMYADVIAEYDIIMLQEICDKQGTSVEKLNSFLPDYEYQLSSRAGRSSYKEQYGIMYRKGIEITSFRDYNPDKGDRWERPPIEVNFDIGGYDLTVYTLHTKPRDVKTELSHLEKVVDTSGNIAIIGDLNADNGYYNKVNENEFSDWNWVIPDTEDTTLSQTKAAYDRILLNDDAFDSYIDYGVHKENVTSQISDHYPVWVELGLK